MVRRVHIINSELIIEFNFSLFQILKTGIRDCNVKAQQLENKWDSDKLIIETAGINTVVWIGASPIDWPKKFLLHYGSNQYQVSLYEFKAAYFKLCNQETSPMDY